MQNMLGKGTLNTNLSLLGIIFFSQAEKLCDVDEELLALIKKFRFDKGTNPAAIMSKFYWVTP